MGSPKLNPNNNITKFHMYLEDKLAESIPASLKLAWSESDHIWASSQTNLNQMQIDWIMSILQSQN